MASWIILSCAVSKFLDAILLAGIIRQYSKKAIPQLNSIIKKSGVELFLYLRLPYQAKVIKTFEATKRTKGQYLLIIDILNYSLVYISFMLWYFNICVILVFFCTITIIGSTLCIRNKHNKNNTTKLYEIQYIWDCGKEYQWKGIG